MGDTLSPVRARHAKVEVRSCAYGRGVFAVEDIPAREIVEVAPVIVLKPHERPEGTLRDYVYDWDPPGAPDHIAVALGLGSLFNHHPQANMDFRADYAQQAVVFRTRRLVLAGEELTIDYHYDADVLAARPELAWYRAMEHLRG